MRCTSSFTSDDRSDKAQCTRLCCSCGYSPVAASTEDDSAREVVEGGGGITEAEATIVVFMKIKILK